MKKLLLFLAAILLVFGVVGTASAVAIPFQIGTGGYLEETVTGGPGILGSWEALGTDVFWLDEGETSQVIDFFDIWTPLAWAEGTVTANVELLSPSPSGDVYNTGTFELLSFFFVSNGSVTWDDPEAVPYSYGGMDGGLLTLDLIDIPSEWQCGTHYTFSGTIKNNQAPVPEPATMLLVGVGLIGLAGLGRRKFVKKT